MRSTGEVDRGACGGVGSLAPSVHPVKIRKLRVLVVLPELLEKFADDSYCDGLEVRVPHHQDRIRTLRSLCNLWLKEKEKPATEKTLTGMVRVWRRSPSGN